MGKTCIVTVTQGDWQYLDEWIRYHLGIGVDLILIGYNGKSDEFVRLPRYGRVRYVDFSVVEGDDMYRMLSSSDDYPFSGFMDPDSTVNNWYDGYLQVKVLNLLVEYVRCFFHDIEWCCIIDTDEFIDLRDGTKDINEFFSRNFPKENSSYSMLMRFYNDNGLIYNDGRPCMERFTCGNSFLDVNPSKSCWYLTKIVVNLRHPDVLANRCHVYSSHLVRLCDPMRWLFDNRKIELRHYWTKTLEEWISKLSTDNDRYYFTRFRGKIFSEFFFKEYAWNELTNEKLRAIPVLLKKYGIDYKPEVEEKDVRFVEAYKLANKIM